jgi:hypothetical protein
LAATTDVLAPPTDEHPKAKHCLAFFIQSGAYFRFRLSVGQRTANPCAAVALNQTVMNGLGSISGRQAFQG